MKKIDKYTFFYKAKISQWTISFFVEDNIEYFCVEQYMMAKKALLFNDNNSYKKIMDCTDPKEIQELGRLIKNFEQNTWNENKEEIVYKGNYLKFTQNKVLKEILLSTKDTLLVEASPIDRIWGIGMSIENPDLLKTELWGENLLGKILTRLRENLLRSEL